MKASILRRLQIISVLCIIALATYSPAQTITLRLVNGKTGKPFTNQNLRVEFWWDNPAQSPNNRRVPVRKEDWSGQDVFIDKSGIAHIPVPPKATLITLGPGSKIGKEPYRVPYINCTELSRSNFISIAEVLEHGYVPTNSCNTRLKPQGSPGEILYFGWPIPWWWPDMQ